MSNARVISPQRGTQTKFSKSSADIAIFGGSAGAGKTFSLLIEALRHIDNPGYRGVIFRRVNPQITIAGGLWDASLDLYGDLGKPTQSKKEWVFPSGARIQFRHLQYESDIYALMGSEIPYIGWDELSHFSSKQFFYLLSRNRSNCGMKPVVRATCNPDAGSWLAGFLSWWIDQETGYPIPNRSGALRWFYRVADEMLWYDTKLEAVTANPELAHDQDGNFIPPKSVTFVPSKLSDNAIFCASNPEYRANLLAMSFVERSRLLDGNWKVTAADGMFRPEWFPDFPQGPTDWKRRVRAWDFACLVAGTMIQTGSGPKPIESVKPGEMVLTRQGYKPVKKAWLTKYVDTVTSVEFTNGSTLTGTSDHRVFTQNRGWIPLDELRSGDYITTTTQEGQSWAHGLVSPLLRTQKQSFSTVSTTPEDQGKNTSKHGGMTHLGRIADGPMRCTGPFGVTIRGQSRQASTCITKAETTTIMPSRILNCFPEVIMPNCTTRLQNSMGQKPGSCTKRNLLRHLGPQQHTRNIHVDYAIKSSHRGFREEHFSARKTAVANSTEQDANPKKIAVYDLEVEDAHEFFANGILVHNSTEAKDADDPDWTVGVLMGQTKEGHLWVPDVKRVRSSPAKVKALLVETTKADGPSVIQVIEQEPGASGKYMASDMVELVRKELGSSYQVIIDRPDRRTGDKVTRAQGWSAACERGEVRLVSGVYVSAFRSEHQEFPFGSHDDQVDASSSAYRRLTGTANFKVI